ncbi:MAG: UDP-N-acetylglucosamine 1-carboxyvinyltransferase [Clostridia bacterium]|nr:UDP-N-acetylglucosamine 1-carboxyvinyltransferase [Clostridia bacterium]
MARFVIDGGRRLNGEFTIQGAKNSALPLLSASLLVDGLCELENCPDLSDVHIAARVLETAGCACHYVHHVMTVDATGADRTDIPEELMNRMRSSVLFLGALLGRFGRAVLSAPGGCELGLRPIDLHLDALRRMGADIREEHGRIVCAAPERLHGCTIDLPLASVGATENVMIAAATAQGTTLLRNAAREPEIVDLAAFLRACGAEITGDGTTTIRIEGRPKLHGCRHRVIPDRIAAGTYLCACAMCGGTLRLCGVDENGLVSVLPRLEEMGCRVAYRDGAVLLRSDGVLHSIRDVATKEFPGFPADMQPILLAAVSKAHGTTLFVENIFSNRYQYVEGLRKMGANVRVIDRVAVVEGVPKLSSAHVTSPDLRGGAALVLAALAADGRSVVDGVEHIDRGYERMEEALASCGAVIQRSE